MKIEIARSIYCLFLLLGSLSGVAQDGDLLKARQLVNSRTSFDEARTLLQKSLARNSNNAEAHFLLGKVLYSFAQYEAAAAEAEKAISITSSESSYHLLLAYSLSAQLDAAGIFKQMSLANRIRAEFEQAAAYDAKSIRAASGLAEFYNQAPTIAGGSYEKAVEQVKRIAAMDPIQGHYIMAALYMERKKSREAEEEYKAAIDLDAKKAKSYSLLGLFYIGEKKDDEALPLFRQALKLDPDYLPPYLGIARSDLLKGEKFDEAEEYFKRYLSRWPDDGEPTLANAHWRLGQLYQKQGKMELAIAEWKEAIRLIPNYQPVLESLKQISSH